MGITKCVPKNIWRGPFLAALFISTLTSAALPQNGKSDLVVVNATVRTMSEEKVIAQAIAVIGDTIAAVGSDEEIKKLIGTNTITIDAMGRLVLPGFNDSHVHFMSIGNLFSSIDLGEATSGGDIAKRIARYSKYLPKGRWILGSGVPSDIAVTKLELETAAPENPVFIYRTGAHEALVNSQARDRAGLKPANSAIAAGDDLAMLRAVVPKKHLTDWSSVAETATNYAASLGVTSVQDMQSDDMFDIYAVLERQGKLKTRIYDCVSISNRTKKPRTASNTTLVRGGCVKGFWETGDDGATELLERGARAADKDGFQVMVHAIGSRPVSVVLGIFERMSAEKRAHSRRFRIEHAHHIDAKDIAKFARFKIIASMQPHLFDRRGDRYRGMIASGVPLAFGSDASIADFDPLLGIHSAVNAESGNALTVQQAVEAYTIGSAYAEFQERNKGTIEVGKVADFIILSDDIFAIDRLRIRDASIVKTIMDGRLVYDAK
ncbi:MAG: amidohydrolase [Pyrinomonadaceae bacterium]